MNWPVNANSGLRPTSTPKALEEGPYEKGRQTYTFATSRTGFYLGATTILRCWRALLVTASVSLLWCLCQYPGPRRLYASECPGTGTRSPAFLIEAKHGAVAAENERCSTIGVQVLKEGGNAVDAAITSALCVGVVNMFS